MNSLFAGNGTASQLISMLLVYGVVIGGMYLLLFRPQQKKRKQEEEMRKSVQIGDEIVTIGGIVGRIVSIRFRLFDFGNRLWKNQNSKMGYRHSY